MAAARASSARWALRFKTVLRLYQRQAEWSTVQKSTWPLSAATRYIVMTQYTVQFSGAVIIGTRRDSTTCFTGRQVTPLYGAPSPNPLKRGIKKRLPQRFI